MKFTTTTLSLLALAFTSTAVAQLEIPIFSCPAGTFGGCCKSFLAAGDGVSCVRGTVATGDGVDQYECNDLSTDVGLPACCHTIPHVGHSIPLPCAIGPQFVCPPNANKGGCCKEFTSGGVGAGCVPADALIFGAKETFECGDSTIDQGIPACCSVNSDLGILDCVAGPMRK
ncbi:hypothetical protein G7Y89_g7670 [Cudoniella acicularis]|uniref:Uncharacterized protein n=1 Tax=Cudoniella acicularis TaxID=354080 RepID=A0A8H4RI03_9HELO|nr:hypothetical protein G7Y89_g7670 [Cudoniella acicularis]